MALQHLLEKASDTDLLREMIGFAAERLMALEVDGLCGAGHGERSAGRTNQRNGLPRARLGDAGGQPAPADPEAAPGVAISRASWSPGGAQRRPWWR